MDELKAKHKKELKSLDGEKRTALKKIKGTAGKGKKGKEALAKAEVEWSRTQEEMVERHTNELSTLSSTADTITDSADTTTTTTTNTITSTQQQEQQTDDTTTTTSSSRTKHNLQKAKRKQAEREAQLARESQLLDDARNAGPSAREVELSQIRELYLSEAQLEVKEVTADGNCLYRAVAEQVNRRSGDGNGGVDYGDMRRLCAETLSSNQEEYAPFAELDDVISTFDGYIENVRSSSEWGGHLELRALAVGLKKTIVVYSADAPPLEIIGGGGSEEEDGEDVIRLSFHRNYYALGEHYNCVVSVE
eukprot:CAMPEP_0198262672 /NCGR_PEP_ID=MMETSP1447-20131203/11146_1 /TAXON_ID=420782 /ORGANISM="Chaetoceros dichaeta, Strain CCMP1751" /LENGTH=305 /DNA_ID=CAMNT_0043950993 /DNA_START=131 /DNA_END=1048 /DNA_ORIENTATION=-